jgi:hypothetical protein
MGGPNFAPRQPPIQVGFHNQGSPSNFSGQERTGFDFLIDGATADREQFGDFFNQVAKLLGPGSREGAILRSRRENLNESSRNRNRAQARAQYARKKLLLAMRGPVCGCRGPYVIALTETY